MGLLDRVFGEGNKNQPSQEAEAKSASDQSHEDQQICAYVKSKVDEIRTTTNRITSEGIWLTNSAYLKGFDNIYFDTTLRQFRPLKPLQGIFRKNRVFVNKILPTVNNRLARLCKNQPRWEVRPNSNSNEDKEAARLTQQVLQSIWDNQCLNEKRQSLYMWLQQCGHAYLKVSYDDQLGKPQVDPMTNELIYEGDVRIDVVSAFEVFPDPLATRLDECKYLIHCKVRHISYFPEQYPERGHLVKPEGVWLTSLQNEQRVNTVNNLGRGDTQANPNQNSAIEMTLYEKRSKKYPQGRMVVVANGIKLADKSLPVGEIPFAKFDDIIIGGSYYPESLVTHLRPVQDQFVKNVSMRAQWMNRLLAGKYLAAKGHGLIEEALNDQSGEVVEFDPVPNAPPPQPLQVPAIPQYAYKEDETLTDYILDISGINQISRGQLPSSSIPAKGMEFLQEQDDTRIGVITEQHEHAWASTLRFMAMYAQEFYQTPRLLKVAGKNMQYTFKSFLGADMRSNNDVKVLRGSTVPGSKVVKNSEILNVFGQGLLGDPMDPKVREKVFGELEFGTNRDMWEDYGIDMAQIQRTMDAMKEGQVPQVNEFDNHALHIQEKNKIRKSEEYENYSPEVQTIWLADMNAHLDFIVKQTNPQIDAQKDLGSVQEMLAQDEVNEAEDNPLVSGQAEAQGLTPQPQMAGGPIQ